MRSMLLASTSMSSVTPVRPVKPTVRSSVGTKAFLNLFGNKAQEQKTKREQLKVELLDLIAPLERGIAATEEDKAEVDRAATALEKLNPTPKSLCDLLTGKWELLYTTSDSILGKSRPAFLRPYGKIYQTIDAANLTARNTETAPFYNQVYAELTPLSASEVKVQFKEFKIFGLIPVKSPESARGTLEVTYLDDDLRISRGNRSNLFVLRMADRDGRP